MFKLGRNQATQQVLFEVTRLVLESDGKSTENRQDDLEPRLSHGKHVCLFIVYLVNRRSFIVCVVLTLFKNILASVRSTLSLEHGKWTHIAATYLSTSGRLALYFNGQLQNEFIAATPGT